MAFSIEPQSLISFLNEPKIKLPRFQRKETWDDKQKFQLCISVFKGYPVGVVIYNCSKDGAQWLLDGRQRRNALKTAWENPVNVYNYARAFLRFNNNASPDDIRNLFWSGVYTFLQADKSGTSDHTSDADPEGENEDFVVDSIDPEEQKGKLKILLKLILMVHGIRQGTSAWEKRFDFSKFLVYSPFLDNGKVNPKKLKTFLLNFANEHPLLNFEQFAKELFTFPLREDAHKDKFKEYLEQNFESIRSDIETIKEAEDIFSGARIGVISLNNVSPLDAQNIFSLVNSGGTQLKAEELLSAKQFWNEPFPENLVNLEIRTLVQNLYRDLNIPGDDTVNSCPVVRWDICATLLDRIDKNHLLFPAFSTSGKRSEVNMTKIALGFKLASAISVGGISSKHIEKMEKCKNWEEMIASLIDDINKIAEILLNVNFYHNLNAWKKSIWDLLGSSATLEFIAILHKNWQDFGKPIVDGTNRWTFIHNSLILLDRLFYEYSNNRWRGSGDNKMAKDFANIHDRLSMLETESWISFVRNASKVNADYKLLTPVLYYFSVLQKKSPDSLTQNTYDIDHIVPQSRLEALDQDTEVNGVNLLSLKDTLGNLALLPHRSNMKKTDKVLNEIDNDLKEEVAKYSDVACEDFDKYSDVSKLPELCEQRMKIFMQIVDTNRASLFANNRLV